MTTSSCPYAVALRQSSPSSAWKKNLKGEDDDAVTTTATTTTNAVAVSTLALQHCPAFSASSSSSSTPAIAGGEPSPSSTILVSCPFKDCSSMEEIRNTLLKIPHDHFETNTTSDNNNKKNHSFLEILQVVHSVAAASTTTTTDTTPTTTTTNHKNHHGFSFGTCPVASIVTPTLSSNERIQKIISSSTTTTAPNHDPDAAAATTASWSFTQAMEQCSLASIMAKMAQQMEHQQQPQTNASTSQQEMETPNSKVSSKGNETQESVSTSGIDNDNHSSSQQQQLLLLSKAFQVGTQDSHQAAENVHFVKHFIQGKIDRHLYVQLLQRLYPVYQTLEQHILLLGQSNQQNQPFQKDSILQRFESFHERLKRTQTLARDLEFWNGSSGTTTQLSPATKDYVDRISYIAQSSEPWLLLAHSYTRYLGDLSGGKILGRVARKALFFDTRRTSKGGSNDELEGLAFYDFSRTIPSAKRFKDEYRNALDQLNVTEVQLHRLVAEANVAFVLNIRLFEELDVLANVSGASVRPLAEALAYAETAAAAEKHVQNSHNNNVASCHSTVSTMKTTTSTTTTTTTTPCPFIVKSSTNSTTTTTTSNASCPFLVRSKDPNNDTSNKYTNHGTTMSPHRCPWPFILLHDPRAALRDWQTWAVLGLILCFAWSRWVEQQQQHIILPRE